jgi:hypothetical protein
VPRRRSETEVRYVEHPRWGSQPRYTGLDVAELVHGGEAFLRWQDNIEGTRPIRGTAVAADPGRQTPATIPVTHSYDVEREIQAMYARYQELVAGVPQPPSGSSGGCRDPASPVPALTSARYIDARMPRCRRKRGFCGTSI